MQTIRGELVSFQSTKGLWLDGVLFRCEGSRSTVIHVHGSMGNFYQNKFIRIMAGTYVSNGYNVLSFNTSAHDCVSEGYRGVEGFEYVGGGVCEFSECEFDIAGAIEFCRDISDRVVLQGHSLGCDRVLYYMLKTNDTCDIILLSPCDSYKLQETWIGPETVLSQIERLEGMAVKEDDLCWLDSREYGVRQGDWVYSIPITRKALLSIMCGPPFKLIRAGTPVTYRILQKTFVVVGEEDVLQTMTFSELCRYLKERIERVTTFYVSGADHMLSDREELVATKIVEWLSR